MMETIRKLSGVRIDRNHEVPGVRPGRPARGSWAVPCMACQTHILEALCMIGCNRDAEKMHRGLLLSCQMGNEASICIAKNLLAVAENTLTASTSKNQRQAS